MRHNPSIIMRLICIALVSIFCAQGVAANRAVIGTSKADKQLAEYFRYQTTKLSERCLTNIKTLDDWKKKRPNTISGNSGNISNFFREKFG